MLHKLIIIGSGPAGLTAGIYAGRAELAPLLFEGEAPGGPLVTTTVVENYPGFPKGIDGPELVALMRRQAERFNVKIITKNVLDVDFKSRPFKVYAGAERKEYLAKSIIIATGTEARKLGLDSERQFAGRGVSYCATCDGPLFKNKKVVVVGGGDSAMEEALFISKFASQLTLIHRREELSASKIMEERARANKKIKWMLNTEIKEFIGGNSLEKIKLVNNKTNKESVILADGAFLAIGRIPNTKIFEGKLKMEKGYIITERDSTRTSAVGVYSAGDVSDWAYRQAVVAAGRGAMAAIEAERYLEQKK